MKKLGPYDFEGTLGRGGMGTVFRGTHRETGELHAVKVLSPVYSHDDHFRGRFESEINALLQLDHPNIVKLISYGQEDGMLYFSMELIEGNSLFQMQKKGHRFNWRECLQIAKDVCQGLRHAHDRGIIHRDLKPGNLLMTQFNSVKITDFGIAKSFGNNQNTGDNILGTMDFMSPEQAKGEPVTFRSDLYSLGAVLYTLLSGRPPFTANSIEESLRNLTRVPAPKIGKAVPSVPKEIEDIIAKLMEKKPEKRVSTALALNHRLEDIEEALKTYSEAKTAETGSLKNPTEDDDEHLTLNIGKDMATITHITDHSTSSGSKGGASSSHAAMPTRADKTVVDSAVVSSDLPESTGRPRSDFHNRVSPMERASASQAEEDPIEARYGKGVLRTLLMLLAVVSLATIGMWTSYQTPSADQLYAEIQSNPPSAVLEQCERFMESYPEDERADIVKRTFEFGKATKYYSQLSNKLEARSNLIGKARLTEIERQFLQIANLAKSNFEAANNSMDAFVRVHDSNPDMSQRDRECVDAAKIFRLKIREDAQRQAKTNLNSIRNAMKRAAEDEPAEAAKTYRSIIALYDSMSEASNPEVRQLVKQAKQLLAKLPLGDAPDDASTSQQEPSDDE
ncbi:serine/threonine protein kinase [Mariniblastus fucicola]|nr:serine/threonine-protein kinase [Mariniblastus fucicola]